MMINMFQQVQFFKSNMYGSANDESSEEEQFCSECGAKISPTAKFCRDCGVNLS